MIRKSSLILFEIVAGFLAIVALGAGLLAWRLSQGPIPLPMVEAQIEAQLTAARSGRRVDVQDVMLVWAGAERGLQVEASKVQVLDAAGKPQTSADRLDIGIDISSLFLGRFALSRLSFEGGEATLTLAADGSAALAFGGPGAAPDLKIPKPEQNRPLLEQVNWALDALASAMKPLGPGGQLKRVAAKGVKLTIQDEAGGAIWQATDARLEGSRTGDRLALNASASFSGPRGPAPASLAITTDPQFSAALIELTARDVRLNALLPPNALGPLEKFRAPITAAVALGVDRARGVTRLDGDVTLGRGEVEVAGGKLALNGASFSGRYDLKSDILVLDDVALAGARTRVAGEIRFRTASAFLGVRETKVSEFDMNLSRLELDVPGFLGEATPLTDVSAKGRLLIAQNAIELDSATAYLDGVPARAKGRFALGDDGAGVIRPAIQLDATLEGAADVRKIIAFWPKPLDPLARGWADARIESGTVSKARARLDLRPQDVRGLGVPRERIQVDFAFANARVRYMDGMAPVERASGTAKVEGDRFDLALAEGTLNGLAVGKGRVFLPSLAAQAREPAQYQLTASGDLKSVVDVLRQAPLGVDGALPFNPASLTGAGTVGLNVRVARPRADRPEVVTFNVDGRFEGVGGVFRDNGARLTDARVTVKGDERALTFSGPAALGASRAEVVWTETLKAPPPSGRSRFAIAGKFDARELAALGFPVDDAISGPIGLELRGYGDGPRFSSVGVRMDLRQAVLRLPASLWTKPAGQDATLVFEARRSPDGSVRLNDLDLRGEGGLFAAGMAEFAPDHRLLSAQISRFTLGGKTNVAVRADRSETGALRVAATGAAFDLGPWLGASNGPPPPGPPLTTIATPATAAPAPATESVVLALDVDRASMLGGAVLSGAKVRLETAGPSVGKLSIDGRTPDGEAFSLAVGDGDGGGPLRFSAGDAGFAVRGFTGADNVRGGRVEAIGSWAPGAPGRADFTVQASDFKVVRMGALAELLSSVSSLTGLVDTLNGEGIAFRGLEAPMTLDNGRLSLKDARAAGDSLGITMKGNVDLGHGRVALDGVVAPAFGINGMLTDVPVLGTLLTSRPGEGVVGITYTVAGPTDQLKVGVNPLSALAPGILRRMFEPWTPREPRQARTRATASR